MLNIGQELLDMEKMTAKQLREKYRAAFGEDTRSCHKAYLIRKIAWRLQANAEGGLSERARERATALANDADLRLMPPRTKLSPPTPDKAPAKSVERKAIQVGQVIERHYKGRYIRVIALADGFEFEGNRHRSLTAIAKLVTGKHWNGHHFFGFRGRGHA